MKFLLRGLLISSLVVPGVAIADDAFAQVPEEEPPPEEIVEEGEENTVRDQPTAAAPTDVIEDTAVAQPERESLSVGGRLETEPATEEGPLRSEIELSSAAVAGENLDFRPLDNETFIDIQDSDDRQTVLYTLLGARLEYDVVDDVTLGLGALHAGAWGGDNLGSANVFGGVFYVTSLWADWNPVDLPSMSLSTRIGRQYFTIGGASTDFFMEDIIDGVTITADFKKAGRLRLLPFDVFAATRPDDINLGDAFGFSGGDRYTPAVNFGGDTNTFRFGGVYENTELVPGLAMRGFGFYADIGAGSGEHTGADRVFNGAHGNFSDNDYNWMAGTRIGYTFDTETFELGTFVEYARSGGMDRKPTQIGVRDVTANGNAFGAGVLPRLKLGDVAVRATGRFFLAEGPSYTGGEGLLFNYGFVSFKGDQVGGLNMNRFAGWHPSSYVGTRGISFSPHDVERKSGTMAVQGGLGVDLFSKVRVDFDTWFYQDTGTTNLDFDNIDAVADELPFGYTGAADLEPQRRLSRSLGTEFNATLAYQPAEVFALHATGGVFLPAEFYEIEIDRTGGTARGYETPENFWAFTTGASLQF